MPHSLFHLYSLSFLIPIPFYLHIHKETFRRCFMFQIVVVNEISLYFASTWFSLFSTSRLYDLYVFFYFPFNFSLTTNAYPSLNFSGGFYFYYYYYCEILLSFFSMLLLLCPLNCKDCGRSVLVYWTCIGYDFYYKF